MSKFKFPNKMKKNNNNHGGWFMVTNPWTGAMCVLNEVQKNMYVRIKELEFIINSQAKYELINEFDNLRYEFAEKWNKEYMMLLD